MQCRSCRNVRWTANATCNTKSRPTDVVLSPSFTESLTHTRRRTLAGTEATLRIRLGDAPVSLVRSKKRIADHGEVFTPPWMVEGMLDLVQDETQRIDSRFLEPACGSGNFLVPVLDRKLAVVERKYGTNPFEKLHYALFSLMCIYGIELLEDNAGECRENLLDVIADFLKLSSKDEAYLSAKAVLDLNVVHGDALTMRTQTVEPEPIVFAEWSYLGKGQFQRRDFRFDALTQMSSFGSDTLFGNLAKHEIFVPVRDHAPLTIRDLADA